MHDPTFLQHLVLILAVAVAVVAALRRIGVPSIAGFIVAGALLGPRGFHLISDSAQVETLAEIGVVLLLFGIGLELSFERLRRLWRPILLVGALQVAVTVLGTAALARVFGHRAAEAVFLGFLVAVSSTAVVLRGLEARGEIDAPHGRLTLGVLLFQDLLVIPMLLAIPLLSGAAGSMSASLAALVKAVTVLAAVLVAAVIVVPRVLHLVSLTRQRDLFVLTVLLVCLGTAWTISRLGGSLSLGAFLAGLVVAGSRFRHQALADVLPFREALASLFFISLGMLLDPAALVENGGSILALVGAIVVGKFVVVFLAGMAVRLSLRVCVLAGVALAQVGEFSFVLAHAARGTGLLEGAFAANLWMAVILSLLVTPLLLMVGPHIAAGVGKSRRLTRLLDVRTSAEACQVCRVLRDHVIIAGFATAGQDLARSLKVSGVPYLIVDINPRNVRAAARMGEPAVFGDITSEEVISLLGAGAAAEMVVVINDAGAAERATRAARRIAPELPILVRARYLADVEGLLKAGATDVVVAEVEASGEIAARVLACRGVAAPVIADQVARIRDRRTGRAG